MYILFRKFATLQRVAEERTGDHIYKLHYHMQPLSSGIAEDSEDSTIAMAAQCVVKIFLKKYSLFFMEGTVYHYLKPQCSVMKFGNINKYFFFFVFFRNEITSYIFDGTFRNNSLFFFFWNPYLKTDCTSRLVLFSLKDQNTIL